MKPPLLYAAWNLCAVDHNVLYVDLARVLKGRGIGDQRFDRNPVILPRSASDPELIGVAPAPVARLGENTRRCSDARN